MSPLPITMSNGEVISTIGNSVDELKSLGGNNGGSVSLGVHRQVVAERTLHLGIDCAGTEEGSGFIVRLDKSL